MRYFEFLAINIHKKDTNPTGDCDEITRPRTDSHPRGKNGGKQVSWVLAEIRVKVDGNKKNRKFSLAPSRK